MPGVLISIDNKKYRKRKEDVEQRKELTPKADEFTSMKFEKPEELDAKELVVWDDLVSRLKMITGGYVSDADKQIMVCYCRNKVLYDEACKNWKKNKSYYVVVETGEFDRSGVAKTALKKNPNMEMIYKFSEIMLKELDALGLSPIGRAKQGLAASQSKTTANRDAIFKISNESDDDE